MARQSQDVLQLILDELQRGLVGSAEDDSESVGGLVALDDQGTVFRVGGEVADGREIDFLGLTDALRLVVGVQLIDALDDRRDLEGVLDSSLRADGTC